MAGEVALTPLLLGLGVDGLSTGAALVPRVKSAVQSLTLAECSVLAETSLKMDSTKGVYAVCEALGRERYPDLF